MYETLWFSWLECAGLDALSPEHVKPLRSSAIAIYAPDKHLIPCVHPCTHAMSCFGLHIYWYGLAVACSWAFAFSPLSQRSLMAGNAMELLGVRLRTPNMLGACIRIFLFKHGSPILTSVNERVTTLSSFTNVTACVFGINI
jgi:hypothetical protein